MIAAVATLHWRKLEVSITVCMQSGQVLPGCPGTAGDILWSTEQELASQRLLGGDCSGAEP